MLVWELCYASIAQIIQKYQQLSFPVDSLVRIHTYQIHLDQDSVTEGSSEVAAVSVRKPKGSSDLELDCLNTFLEGGELVLRTVNMSRACPFTLESAVFFFFFFFGLVLHAAPSTCPDKERQRLFRHWCSFYSQFNHLSRY